MEEDKIKELFTNFDPQLSSSFEFMSILKKNLAGVEIVKAQYAKFEKRNKLAVIIAAVSGFAIGVVFTLLFQSIGTLSGELSVVLPNLNIQDFVDNYRFIPWIVTGITCVITSLNAYEIALAKLR